MTPKQTFETTLRKAVGSSRCMIHVACNDEYGNFSNRAEKIEIYSVKDPTDHIVGFDCKYADAAPRFTRVNRNLLRLCRMELRPIHQSHGVGNIYWNAWNVPTYDVEKLLSSKGFLKWFQIEGGELSVFNAWRALSPEAKLDPTFLVG